MSNILNNQKNQESSSSNLFQIYGHNDNVKNGTNHIDQKQKEIKYEYDVVQHLKQQAQKEIQRRRQIIKLVHSFIDAESRFKKEQFFDRRFIYLISKNWINQWKKYTQFELISNKKMLSLKNSYDLTTLPKMNENIVDLSFQSSIKLEKYEEIDVCIKQNLREEEDFIYANEQMISLFANYQSITIKREIIQVKGEKIIDLYPLKITLVLITNKILTQIKLKKRTQPIIQTLLFSKSGSAANFQLYVFEHIVNALNIRHALDHKEVVTSQSNIQYYFLNPTYQKDRLLKRIQLSLQSQLYAKEHSIFIPIQPLDYKSPISEVVICSEPIIICEIREKSDPKQRRMLYNNQKIFPFIKCPTCKTQLELKCQCKCRHIAYCSENCENADIQHRKKCNSKNKQGTKKVIQQNRNKNGLVGLVNLGNTCFMNSGLQCLSHIRQLTQYFLSDAYSKDINTTSNLGTQGKLAKSYSVLLKNLWLQYQSRYSPHDFKKILGGFQRNYLGYSQQDSGELITHILDALHEDLNKIKTKPYFQSKDIDYRPQQVIADEQWEHFLKRNNSKIVELMYGQFRSEVSCPECKFKSVQFDPFSMCSVPIPQLSFINAVFQDDENLSEETLMIPYKQKDRLSKVIEHIRLIKNISEEFKLIAYSSKTELNLDCDVHEIKLKYKANLMIRVLSPEYQSLTDSCKVHVIFKAPGHILVGNQICFQKLFKFKANLSLVQIHQILYEQIRKLIDLGDYHKLLLAERSEHKISIYNQRNSIDECWKCNSRCRSFSCYFPYSQKKIGQVNKGKIITLNYIIKSQLKKQYKIPTKVKGDEIRLLDCFSAFEDPEILTKDNAWKCPKCLMKVSAKKRMMLFKLPKILIICLKRFKKKVYGSQKNHSYVSFPLKGLDLTSKVISKQLPSISNQRSILSSLENNKAVIYDLFGVSYHFGDAGSGHYNAACKNQDRNGWFKFDDQSVSAVDETSVSNSNAYILFYRRK